MFCHLHTHSYYSFLEGIPSPKDLVAAAASYAMPALALTDHNSLTGVLSFYLACREAGIRPILGLEIDLFLPYTLSQAPAPDTTGRLVLLAEDLAGWQNLCRLSSSLYMTGKEGACRPASLADIEQFSNGLVCLTGGCTGAIERLYSTPDDNKEGVKLAGNLRDIFSNRLYLEIQRNRLRQSACEDQLIRLADDLALPVVAAHPIYMIDSTHAQIQRTLAAIREIVPLAGMPGNLEAPPDSFFHSPADMEKCFHDLPRALLSVDEIVTRCSLELPLGAHNFPKIHLPDDASVIDVLREKAESGAIKMYGSLSLEIRARLDSELDIIAASGFEPIFLIAEEMISYAHKQGIPSASRGSASSSLVAHCMGITTPDPLELNLYFERFLNPARTTPPDIDTDFCSHRRDDVIQHLFDLYGRDKVAMVGTVNTFRPRSALSDVAKAHGLKPVEIKTLTRRLSHRFRGHAPDPDKPSPSPTNPYAELMIEHSGDQRLQNIFLEASAILGMPHHLSVHPGGVVIAPGPICEYVPLARSGGKGITITQFDLDDVERMGLVKLDLLGIRGLTVLGNMAEAIYTWRRKEFSNPIDVLESVPGDDPDTAALVSSGRTIGCFNIESPGMRSTLKEIQARSPADIMAALALYRPGPLKGGLRDSFVLRHKRLEPVIHIHPALETILRETYGVILYQEQVLRIAHDLAGLNMAESDMLRRAMSHFDPGKQMKLLEEKFIDGVEKHSGIPPETGLRIWQMMAAFAGYGFPKAHAASYAQVAWRSAWCKAHYTPEFLAAVLANWGGYYPQSVYLNEARRLKIKVHPPHVNHSHSQFTVIYPHGEPVLYMGLDQLRDLTKQTQDRIIQFRPYHSLADFLLRVDPRKQEIDKLIRVGAFEGIGTIPDLLNQAAGRRIHPGQLSLFDNDSSTEPDWSIDQKIAAQQRLLGISVEAHPLEQILGEIRGAGAISTLDAASKIGETVRVVGMRQAFFQNLAAHGEWMATLIIEDLDGMLDAIVFPQNYRRYKNFLANASSPFMFEGSIESDADTGEPVMHIQKIWRVSRNPASQSAYS